MFQFSRFSRATESTANKLEESQMVTTADQGHIIKRSKKEPLRNITNIQQNTPSADENALKKSTSNNGLKTIFQKLALTGRPSSLPNSHQGNSDTAKPDYQSEEYEEDIFSHLKQLEIKFKPSSNYVNKQRETTPMMRTIVVDWIQELCQDFAFDTETFFLSINYLDRFLSKKNVPKKRLQLVGAACLFIAAKYEEISPCTIEELRETCKDYCNIEDILAMEACVLDCLKFDLNVATTGVFVKWFLHISKPFQEGNSKVPVLAMFLAELSLCEYDLLCHNYSCIAASCVVLALHTFRKEYWPSSFKSHFGYSFSELTPCIRQIHDLWLSSFGNGSNLVVRRKYGEEKFQKISFTTPRSSPPKTKTTNCDA